MIRDRCLQADDGDVRNALACRVRMSWPPDRRLSFLNAMNFRADVLKVIRMASPKLLVLEASGILDIDFTAAQMLLELCRGNVAPQASLSPSPV
jgi:hypothetical protein